MTADEPEWLTDFKAKLEEAGREFARLGEVLRVSTAMGAMFKGDFEAAKEQLENLPSEQLSAVSVAASALASLAEEIAGERSHQ